MFNVYAFVVHKYTVCFEYSVSKLLTDKRSLILIHVDQSSCLSLFEILANKDKRIVILKNRFYTKWGSFALVEATIELMRVARKFNYRYFSLLSGDDIVVASSRKINDFFFDSKLEYIAFQNLRKFPVNPDVRVFYKYGRYNFCKSKKINVLMLRMIEKLAHILDLRKISNFRELPVLYKGSQWFSISNEAVFLILQYIHLHDEYINAFELSICSDEIFFHTIIMIYKDYLFLNLTEEINIPQKALRYIDWYSGPNFPKNLNVSDFDNIKASGCLFARKACNDITYQQFVCGFG
jgi:hypothetical protein